MKARCRTQRKIARNNHRMIGLGFGDCGLPSPIPRQLPAFDVPIERPHHADARMHQEIAAFCSADQTRDSSLPFLKVLLSLRQLHDVIGSVLEDYELVPLGQRDRIVEWPLPAS
jgi:hypothetical protein